MCAEKNAVVEDSPWTVEWAARKLGLEHARVRELRAAMVEGEDFRQMSNGRRGRPEMVFTENGLAKLESAVKAALLPQAATAAHANGHVAVPTWALPPDAAWKPFTPDPVTMVIFRRRMRNPYIVEGELEDGTIVRLKIKPSEQWRAGMRLPSVQIGDGFFEFHGRPPQGPGRWR